MTPTDQALFANDVQQDLKRLMSRRPSARRVSESEKWNIIKWLSDAGRRPSTQEEFSRRNYVKKNFVLDESGSVLLAVDKDDALNRRTVVTTDEIAGIVEITHKLNGHAGWDATWNDVRRFYYGILRSDVIFLLKACPICARDPKKRPKGLTSTLSPFHTNHPTISDESEDLSFDKDL